MATKKDLVEAYSFSRRRLVTAFLSGAPGGREVEPSRPGRTVVGGLALAVLLVAGAAIASVLASRTQEDWNQIGLVVSREEAAPYVILTKDDPPTLIPVLNITSAQLILGSTVKPTYVDQEVIEDQTPGDTIGISGAPQTLPRPSKFIETGWTACTGQDLGIQVGVAEDPQVTVPEAGGVVVESDGQYWVIAKSGALDLDQQRAHRYLLPTQPDSENMLTELGLDRTPDAQEVPAEWLALFPEGDPLDLSSFGVTGFGKKLKDPSLPQGARVGDYILSDDATQGVYLTEDGKAAPIDGFALTVYRNAILPDQPKRGGPQQLQGELPPVGSAKRAYDQAHWPDGTLNEVRGQLCAQLDARHDDVPLVDLAAEPGGGAEAPESLAAGQKQLDIERGYGAFVRVGNWDDTTSTSTYVIDPRGYSYALVGAGTVEKLGYADSGETTIPDTWLKLFSEGVSLSTSKALCPPAGTVLPGASDAPSQSPSAAESASASPGATADAPGCQAPVTE